MGTMRISEVAERSGFPAATLRYYEEIGLLTADRTPAGYRVYGDRDLERLQFIARAKQLGVSLDHLRELVGLWEGDRCAPVQTRLAELVDTKHARTVQTIEDLTRFAEDLAVMSRQLRVESADGRCGAECACVAQLPDSAGEPAALGPSPADLLDVVPVACSLDRADLPGRTAQWHELAALAVTRVRIDGGVRLRFAAGPDLAQRVAALAAAEQDCCRFFEFTIGLSTEGTTLDIRAPGEAQLLIATLVGNES